MYIYRYVISDYKINDIIIRMCEILAYWWRS